MVLVIPNDSLPEESISGVSLLGRFVHLLQNGFEIGGRIISHLVEAEVIDKGGDVVVGNLLAEELGGLQDGALLILDNEGSRKLE